MSYCVLLWAPGFVLRIVSKESANKRYRNTVNNLILPNTVSQNDEKPHTAELDDTEIPHVKSKITEIPHEKSLIPQYRKPPCLPLYCKQFLQDPPPIFLRHKALILSSTTHKTAINRLIDHTGEK